LEKHKIRSVSRYTAVKKQSASLKVQFHCRFRIKTICDRNGKHLAV
jgi:hypothetical protein